MYLFGLFVFALWLFWEPTQLPNKYTHGSIFLLMLDLNVAYFQPTFLNFKYPIHLLPLALSFSISVHLSLLFIPCLAVYLDGWPLMSSSLSFLCSSIFPDFSSYLFYLPASHTYLFFCLAIGHSAFYQTNQVFQTGRVKQMQHKRAQHIFASVSKFSTA